MKMTLPPRGGGFKYAKKRQIKKIFLSTPTHLGGNKCMIKKAMKPCNLIVKCMVPESGVQTLGLGQCPWNPLTKLRISQSMGQRFRHQGWANMAIWRKCSFNLKKFLIYSYKYFGKPKCMINFMMSTVKSQNCEFHYAQALGQGYNTHTVKMYYMYILENLLFCSCIYFKNTNCMILIFLKPSI